MPLRPANPEDARPLAALWSRAFPGERTLEERVRGLQTGRPYGGIETAWAFEENRRLLAGFRAFRMTELLFGRPLPMMGLAAVAVDSTARRRGLGRRICEEALRIGRERGDVVSVLYPFRTAFYEALGWGLSGRLESHVFDPGALPHAEEAAAVRHAEAGDFDRLAACYARVTERGHGPIERGEGAWERHLGEERVHPLIWDDGGVRGYLLARFGRGAPDRRTLVVQELVAEDDAARRGLFGWLAAQRDQWPAARYDARPDESFGLWLADPRPPRRRTVRRLWFETGRTLRGPMLRVLDVAAALGAKPRWGPEHAAALTLEIEVRDEQLPENRGPWTVAVEEGGARVHASTGSGADAALRTDAATFAQIYAGELAPTAAKRLGRAELDGAADALDRAFRVDGSFWLLDDF